MEVLYDASFVTSTGPKSNARISKQSRFHHDATMQSRFIIHEGDDNRYFIVHHKPQLDLHKGTGIILSHC